MYFITQYSLDMSLMTLPSSEPVREVACQISLVCLSDDLRKNMVHILKIDRVIENFYEELIFKKKREKENVELFFSRNLILITQTCSRFLYFSVHS